MEKVKCALLLNNFWKATRDRTRWAFVERGFHNCNIAMEKLPPTPGYSSTSHIREKCQAEKEALLLMIKVAGRQIHVGQDGLTNILLAACLNP